MVISGVGFCSQLQIPCALMQKPSLPETQPRPLATGDQLDAQWLTQVSPFPGGILVLCFSQYPYKVFYKQSLFQNMSSQLCPPSQVRQDPR